MGALDELSVESEQEHLLLLAHHVAAALLRRRAGDDLQDVMHHFVQQFTAYEFSKPWETLADEADTEGDTPTYRRDLLEKAACHLRNIFADHELAAPFLDFDVLSSMMGTYELVNMCISIYHPLNSQCSQIAEILKGSTDTRLTERLHELQKGVDEDSDSSSDEEDDEEEGDEKEKAAPGEATASSPENAAANAGSGYPQPAENGDISSQDAEKAALEALAQNTFFANVVGTSLIQALSFLNHSCLPNARIDFATSATPDNVSGPGLWVSAAARRPLIPGDEVQMCYVPSVVGKPLEVRQRRMRKFGFECKCRCCTTDEMLKAEGDLPSAIAGK